MDLDSLSMLHVLDIDKSNCGYCNSEKVENYYLYAERISCDDAEQLLLNGWRRSSNLYYQLARRPTSCISRPIILPVQGFEPTHSQKRVVKQFDRYLKGELDIIDGKLVAVNPVPKKEKVQYEKHTELLEACQKVLQTSLQAIGLTWKQSICCKEKIYKNKVVITSSLLFQLKCEESNYSDLQNVLQEAMKGHACIEQVLIENKFINFYTSYPVPVKSVSSPSPPTLPLKERSLKLVLSNASADPEVYQLYALFEKEIFNNTDVTMESFLDFLGDGFLIQEDDKKLGTFWLKWYVDEELVAVSVLDMYPNILSSVYFFYNPVYRCLSIGIYSAIKEVEFAAAHGKHFYSLGLYIEECSRMRYKGCFRNSFVFCQTTHSFYPLDIVRDRLQNHLMCLEGDEEKLKEAMKDLETKVKSVKDSMLIVHPYGEGLGLFSYGDYEKCGKKTQLLRELLPFLPDKLILYFLDE